MGAVIMDPSKAFDTINYDHSLGKLYAYGFTDKSLRFIQAILQIVHRDQKLIPTLLASLNCF